MRAPWSWLACTWFAWLHPALAGCDNLADESTRAPALAQMRGELGLAAGVQAPAADLRFGLVWYVPPDALGGADAEPTCTNPDGSAGFVRDSSFVEQHTGVEPVFPARFTLAITAPPPAEAVALTSDPDSEIRYALGQLVVYADNNRNGRLDRARDRMPAERILGDSNAAPMFGSMPEYGYNVLYFQHALQLDPSEVPDGGATRIEAGYQLARYPYADPSAATENVPIDTPIAIELTAAPPLQRLGCDRLCDVWEPFECPADPADLPSVPERSVDYESASASRWSALGENGDFNWGGSWCNADSGESGDTLAYFNWFTQTCDPCTCTRRACAYVLDRALPVPEIWPCTEYEDGGGVDVPEGNVIEVPQP